VWGRPLITRPPVPLVITPSLACIGRAQLPRPAGPLALSATANQGQQAMVEDGAMADDGEEEDVQLHQHTETATEGTGQAEVGDALGLAATRLWHLMMTPPMWFLVHICMTCIHACYSGVMCT
jgi:hypothetical protein